MNKPKAKGEYQMGRLVVACSYVLGMCEHCAFRHVVCDSVACRSQTRKDNRDVYFITPKQYMLNK